MRKTFKLLSRFVLLVLVNITAPPIGFLLTLSFARAQQRQSRFAARTYLREVRAGQRRGWVQGLHPWFREALWPHMRASKRAIWAYYSRPGIVLLILACTICILLAIWFLVVHINVESTGDYLSYGLRQVVITGFLAVSICALAWILFSIEFAFKSVFTTLVFSAIVSACVIFARLIAIDFFSRIFPFPAAYTPVAFGIATTLISASVASIVFALLAVLFELYFLFFLDLNFKRNKVVKSMLVGASVLGLLGAWFATFGVFEAIDPKGQLLIVKIAETYDFTTNHMCDAESGEAVLFIDNVADRAIAARFPAVGTLSPKRLAKDGVGKYMPTGFHTVRCNPLDAPVGRAGWCDQPRRFGYCQDPRAETQPVP